MKYIFILALALTVSVLIFRAPRAEEGLRVVELFTSQSCSSCPAADRVLAELQGKPDLIALGFHVTYWDHLHWKDTLSQSFATDRQRNYSRAKGTSRVYTPQMIVNGQAEFIGSSQGELANALRAAKPLVLLGLAYGKGQINLRLPALPQGTYTLWAFETKDILTQSIKSGENGGRTVTYTDGVVRHQALGSWNGEAGSKTMAFTPDSQADRLVILAQKDEYGPIRGAASLDIR